MGFLLSPEFLIALQLSAAVGLWCLLIFLVWVVLLIMHRTKP